MVGARRMEVTVADEPNRDTVLKLARMLGEVCEPLEPATVAKAAEHGVALPDLLRAHGDGLAIYRAEAERMIEDLSKRLA